jgi:hypothetical protein
VKRLLVTGSRFWSDRAVIHDALFAAWRELGPNTVLIHGACHLGGADIIADEIWKGQGLLTEPHPADWKRYGKDAGPIRNQEMVDLGADLCLAFPLGRSTGTRDCALRAALAGIPVWYFEGQE